MPASRSGAGRSRSGTRARTRWPRWSRRGASRLPSLPVAPVTRMFMGRSVRSSIRIGRTRLTKHCATAMPGAESHGAPNTVLANTVLANTFHTHRVAPSDWTTSAIAALLTHQCETDSPLVWIPRPEIRLVMRFGPTAQNGLDVHVMGTRERAQSKGHSERSADGDRTSSARRPRGGGGCIGVRARRPHHCPRRSEAPTRHGGSPSGPPPPPPRPKQRQLSTPPSPSTSPRPVRQAPEHNLLSTPRTSLRARAWPTSPPSSG